MNNVSLTLSLLLWHLYSILCDMLVKIQIKLKKDDHLKKKMLYLICVGS